MYEHIYIYIYVHNSCLLRTGEYSDVPCKSPKRQKRFNECTIILVGFYQLLSSSGGCYTIVPRSFHYCPIITPVL